MANFLYTFNFERRVISYLLSITPVRGAQRLGVDTVSGVDKGNPKSSQRQRRPCD